MSCKAIDRDLDAYVDRELDVDATRAAREHLVRCQACRARVDERQALRRIVQSAPYYAAPDRLRARVSAMTRRASATRRLLTWAAAAALVVAVGGAITLVRSATTQPDAIVEAVVDGHVRSLMTDHLFDVHSTDQHTVKPWFLGKLDFSPPVADLATIGYPLIGGRLDYLDGRPAAALIYERRQHTINVFVSPVVNETVRAIDARTVRGFHVHHWTRDGMSFWAVSDLDDRELTEFVHALNAS